MRLLLMIKNSINISFCYCLLVLTGLLSLQAKESKLFEKPGIGLEIGSWKPVKLGNEAAVIPFGVKGASPFFRFFINSPQFGDWTLRCSSGYWAQYNIENVPYVGSVNIFLLMFDLKQRIVPQARLTPFVSYGASVFIGHESSQPMKYFPFGQKSEIGYGANVGAGLDLLLTTHWVATIEFCFHYVQFNRRLGLTDDYSGSKISTGFCYYF